jgi:hypothetical protein
MEVSGQLHVMAALPPVKNLSTHLVGGWVGPRAGLDALEKRNISCAHRDSNPIVQPVA